ncbi:MAG TPA: HD domain-containing phosphohydrolase [Acidimicrobiales bacterium]|nr:HD domain-containing phosphohydrolase [Acidimicrobiales bacterium]
MSSTNSGLPRSGVTLLAGPRVIADTLTMGIVVSDHEGRIIDVNRAALELLGADESDLGAQGLRSPNWDVVKPDGTPFSDDELPIQMTLATGQACHHVLMGTSNQHHTRRWILVDTVPALLADGSTGVVATFIDTSEALRSRLALELVNAVNHVAMNATDADTCLAQICEAFIVPGTYALAWVAVASPDTDGVEILCAAGATDYLSEGIVSWWGTEPSGRGPTGTALRTGTSQVCLDLPVNAILPLWRERATTFGLGSSLALPFDFSGRRACLTVYDGDRFWFDDDTVRTLEGVVREMSFGLEHVRAMQQLSTAFEGTLAALSQMTESRDPYTAGHQGRVGNLSEAIAVELGFDEPMARLIGLSGEVHDIGKISIPAEILTRPGRLSDIEFDLVKTHCEVGRDILTRASLPWPIAEVASQHHERGDGSGYPIGLTMSHISLPARIVAVADVVEAMMNHRPYRPGLGLSRALEEISDGAGTRYDADVVKVCLRLFDEGFSFAR